MKQTLKVRSAEKAMVSNYEALDANAKRFIGRTYDASLGEAGGWPLKSEAEVIPYRAEYIQALKEGDLIPADIETAKLIGLTAFSK